MRTRLTAEKSIDPPAAVEPRVDARSSKEFEHLEDVFGADQPDRFNLPCRLA